MTEFYEPDEPVEKIKAAFEAGQKFVTADPDREAYEFYADPANQEPAGPGRRRTRRPPAGVRSFRCKHLSVAGSLLEFACGECGPLDPVRYPATVTWTAA